MIQTILISLLFGIVFGFLFRLVMKFLAKGTVRGKKKNLNARGRWLRGSLGLILFIAAYFFSWNMFLLFLAGFCFFEAIFSWCGFYAVIGKNSCNLNN